MDSVLISALASVVVAIVAGGFSVIVAKKNSKKDIAIHDRKQLSEDEKTFRSQLMEMVESYQKQIIGLTSQLDKLTASNKELEKQLNELTAKNIKLEKIIEDLRESNENLEQKLQKFTVLSNELEVYLGAEKRNTYLAKGGK